MLKLLLVVLFLVTFILMSIFITGLIELHKQEKENQKLIVREGVLGYLDQTFGMGTAKIFKTMFDAEGDLRYLVYSSQFEWFKSPKYKWYEVYSTLHGYHHIEVQE